MFFWPYWVTKKSKVTATTWYYRGTGLNWFGRDTWVDSNGNRPSWNNPIGPGDSFTFGSAIDSATAINYNPLVDNFAIGTITFASGCGTVTVTGADVNKVTQIVNESGVVQTFANDVYFDSTLNVRTSPSATTGDPKVLFNGEKGAFGTKFANHNCYRGKNTVDAWKLTETPTNSEIAPDAHVTVLGAMSLSREHNQTFNQYATTIRQGAKLTVLGPATLTGQTGTSGNYIPRLLNGNDGLVEFRGGLTINHTGSQNPAESKFDHYFDSATGRVAVGGTLFFNASGRGNGNANYQSHKCSIKANEIIMLPGLTIRNNGTYRVMLLYTEISKLKWSAAEGDVTFTGYYNSYHDGANYKPFEFSTTDAYDGATPRKITVAGILDGNYQPTSIGFSASGCGTNAFTCAFNFNGGFTAKDTVTVSIDASGARPGSGSVTMQTGTTLAVGKSVTSGSLGNLTLQPGTSLAFNFTSTATAPVLALGGTLTLPSAGQDPVTVKVSANEGLVFDFGTEYEITSGGKFPADAVTSGKVVLSDDSVSWATLFVNSAGNLAVVRKPYVVGDAEGI